MSSESSRSLEKEKAANQGLNIADITSAVADRPTVEDVDRLTKSIKRKIDFRFVPFGMAFIFFNVLDRSNIANAYIMNQEKGDSLGQQLQLTSNEFNITSMLFYISLWVMVPVCNQFLRYVGPNVWLGSLAIGWGTTAMLMSTAKTYAGFATLRFVLGIFESGMFPGLVFSSSFWYRQNERASRISIIFSFASMGAAFGGAIAYAVSFLEGTRGKHAYQWLFIIEGAPTICLGICAILFFPASPEKVSFLTPEERVWASRRLGAASSRIRDLPGKDFGWKAIFQAFRSPYIWLQCLSFGVNSAVFSSLNTFAPVIIAGLGKSSIQSQLLSIPPYALGFFLLCIFAPLADRKNARAITIAAFSFISSIMFLILAILGPGHSNTQYGIFILAVGFFIATVPLLVSWMTTNNNGTEAIAAAVAVGFWFSDAFQVIGAWTYRPIDKPLYHTGHWINFAFLLAECVTALAGRYELIREHKINPKATGETFLAL